MLFVKIGSGCLSYNFPVLGVGILSRNGDRMPLNNEESSFYLNRWLPLPLQALIKATSNEMLRG
jgi:hypothetical protein